MRVAEWMTHKPHTVTPETHVLEAMNILKVGGYRRLPVVQEGRLIGIVTDRDLKNARPSEVTTLSVYELNYLLARLTVRDVMARPVYTVSPEDPISKAAVMMEGYKISGLPVVKRDEVVGILTITDVLKAFISLLDSEDFPQGAATVVAQG